MPPHPSSSGETPGDLAVLHVTRSAVLRACWHPVAFSHDLTDAPISRTLLATPIVVWRGTGGAAHAALDRCPHRWARLSPGHIVDGLIQCPYHGWRFGDDGRAVVLPQIEADVPPPSAAWLDMVRCTERYGMVWISLDAAAEDTAVPAIAEFDDAGFRSIPIGVVTFETSAAAVIDNNTDATHVAFVHAASFGADQDPRIALSAVIDTDFGIEVTSDEMPVASTPGTGRPGWRRAVTEMWLPFTQVGRMHYSDGSSHVLVKGCTPIDDGRTDVHLTVLRNDVDEPADTDAVIEFERTVELEDKAVLDTLPAGFPLDPKLQVHSRHDRPGLAYRRALRRFVAESI